MAISKTPVKINRIKEILPHRYPFLLVDRVIELTESKIVAFKNLTANEEFFDGHFPVAPIMPGVLQVEALAQTAGLHYPLAFPEEAEKNKDKIGVFTKVNNCTFEKPVIPGDQLRLEVTITEIEKDKNGDPRRITARGVASVDGKTTCQTDLEFSMIPAKLIGR
ncbi:MAG TPA: 3-hydroxyacyl-ACP dehydratase FabZ [Leptospiraceae bacterium]|nr:3-hydroxyacyl-ACP dehydratase FabZ [Leptospiraceae bacterium]